MEEGVDDNHWLLPSAQQKKCGVPIDCVSIVPSSSLDITAESIELIHQYSPLRDASAAANASPPPSNNDAPSLQSTAIGSSGGPVKHDGSSSSRSWNILRRGGSGPGSDNLADDTNDSSSSAFPINNNDSNCLFVAYNVLRHAHGRASH